MTSRSLLAFALVALIALILATGSPRDPFVTIHNRSEQRLENVRVWGTGFSETIPRIHSGERVVLRVSPRGESGLGLAFEAGSAQRTFPERGRFDAVSGYAVVVDVAPDLSVSITTRTR